MVHFIIGKFPNLEKMRETFAFLADFFFVLADILILLVLEYSE